MNTLSPAINSSSPNPSSLSYLIELTHRIAGLEERLLSALARSGIGVWVWMFRENDLYWDAQMKRFFRITNGEFSGKYTDFSNRIHPKDLQRCEAAIEKCRREHTEYTYTFRILDSEGGLDREKGCLTLWGRGGLIGPEEDPVGMSGICFDIRDCPRYSSACEDEERRCLCTQGL